MNKNGSEKYKAVSLYKILKDLSPSRPLKSSILGHASKLALTGSYESWLDGERSMSSEVSC